MSVVWMLVACTFSAGIAGFLLGVFVGIWCQLQVEKKASDGDAP